jgi:hypothetical protein
VTHAAGHDLHSPASTFHCFAAAATSTLRTMAPASRSGFQAPRTEVEPPVTWPPSRGSAYSSLFGRRLLEFDFRQVDAEFLGQQHRHRREGALPHLDLVHDQGDDAFMRSMRMKASRARPGGSDTAVAAGPRLFRGRFLAVAFLAVAAEQEKPNSRPPPAVAPTRRKRRRAAGRLCVLGVMWLMAHLILRRRS